MSILNLNINDHQMNITDGFTLPSGGKNLDKIKCVFDSSWIGYEKIAVFYKNVKDVYHIMLEEDETCFIPHEVLSKDGDLYIGIIGRLNESIKTTVVCSYKVLRGAITEETKITDPTPDIYVSILALLETMKNDQDKFIDDMSDLIGAKIDEINGTVVETNTIENRVIRLEEELKAIKKKAMQCIVVKPGQKLTVNIKAELTTVSGGVWCKQHAHLYAIGDIDGYENGNAGYVEPVMATSAFAYDSIEHLIASYSYISGPEVINKSNSTFKMDKDNGYMIYNIIPNATYNSAGINVIVPNNEELVTCVLT